MQIEYAELMKEQEVAQLKKNEDLVLARLKKEDEAARKRAEATMAKKVRVAEKTCTRDLGAHRRYFHT